MRTESTENRIKETAVIIKEIHRSKTASPFAIRRRATKGKYNSPPKNIAILLDVYWDVVVAQTGLKLSAKWNRSQSSF